MAPFSPVRGALTAEDEDSGTTKLFIAILKLEANGFRQELHKRRRGSARLREGLHEICRAELLP